VLWSLGGGEAHALGMFAQVWFLKDLWIRFVEGFSREPKESFRLVEKVERSYVDLCPRAGVSMSVWYQSLILSIYFRQRELEE